MTVPPVIADRQQPALLSWRRRLLTTLIALVVFTLAAASIGTLPQRIDAPAPVDAVEPRPAPVRNTASGMPLVVEPSWLSTQRSSPESPLVLIDLSDIDVYAREHIPGAVHAWWQDGMDLNAASYGQVLSPNPNPTGPRAWFHSLGIDTTTRVIVYDDRHGRDASRFVWLMAFVGLDTGGVLNGGLAAWKGAGLPVTSVPNSAIANEHLSNDIIRHMLIETPELASRLGDPALTIVDIRTPDERADTLNDTLRTGSIPASVPLPWTELVLDESGQLRPTSELQSVFATAGLGPEDDIVVYGQFGIDTGQVWLALRLAGYEKTRIYDEGWALWASRAELPIAP